MKGWYTARELADLNLPGIPTSKRAINRMAKVNGWKTMRGAEGEALARKRIGTKGGGGWEYDFSVIKEGVQATIVVVAEASFASLDREDRLREIDSEALLLTLSPEEMVCVKRVAQKSGVTTGIVVQHWLKQLIAMLQVVA